MSYSRGGSNILRNIRVIFIFRTLGGGIGVQFFWSQLGRFFIIYFKNCEWFVVRRSRTRKNSKSLRVKPFWKTPGVPTRYPWGTPRYPWGTPGYPGVSRGYPRGTPGSKTLILSIFGRWDLLQSIPRAISDRMVMVSCILVVSRGTKAKIKFHELSARRVPVTVDRPFFDVFS